MQTKVDLFGVSVSVADQNGGGIGQEGDDNDDDGATEWHQNWGEPLLRGLRCASTAAAMSCVPTAETTRSPVSISVAVLAVALKATTMALIAAGALASPEARFRRLALVSAAVVASVVGCATERQLDAVVCQLRCASDADARPHRASAAFWVGVCVPLSVCLLQCSLPPLLLRRRGRGSDEENGDWSWHAGLCYHRAACVSIVAELCVVLVETRRRLRRLNGRLSALVATTSEVDVGAEMETARRHYRLCASVIELVERSMGWRLVWAAAAPPLELLFVFAEFVDGGRSRTLLLDAAVYSFLVGAIHVVAVLGSDINYEVSPAPPPSSSSSSSILTNPSTFATRGLVTSAEIEKERKQINKQSIPSIP